MLLAGIPALLLLAGCLVVALGEAATLRARGKGTDRSLAQDIEVAFGIVMLAALPAVIVLGAIAIGIAVVAPGEFGAPDLGGPLILRIAARLLPLWVILAAMVLLGQAFAAAAMRHAFAADGRLWSALRAGLSDLAHNPLRRLGVAATGTAADLLAIGVVLALLRVLWAPISVELAGAGLPSPAALVLLVGFVGVWIATLIGLGLLHAWTSTWWSLEVNPAPAEITASAVEAGA
jgi:hypothetical protein